MNVLCLHCDDKPGIVAAVATCLAQHACNIEESSQFNDPLSKQFFMRVVFSPIEDASLEGFQSDFKGIAGDFAMTWDIHGLHDLLYRWKTGHLNIEITGVVSNHDTCRALAEDHGLNFHHLPLDSEHPKAEQEAALSDIIDDTNAEFVVLARYMQILSDDFTRRYDGRVINIHHSFLPGFKGAKPYHQAYERGVKIIGATAHFASKDLDEGPIIEQEIMHVNHAFTPQKMQAAGRDIEARVLARAVRLYTERRIFLHDSRTVIL